LKRVSEWGDSSCEKYYEEGGQRISVTDFADGKRGIGKKRVESGEQRVVDQESREWRAESSGSGE
jgi:hypothetical protein